MKQERMRIDQEDMDHNENHSGKGKRCIVFRKGKANIPVEKSEHS